MDKVQIGQELIARHQDFINTIKSLSDADFQRKPGKKWTAGQQLEHIVKSVRPVEKAFALPIAVLKIKFGTTNRQNKTYGQLVEEYLQVLKENQEYVLPEQFAPEEIPCSLRDKKLAELEILIKRLNNNIAKTSKGYLNTQILPHPVMGKITLREILYFTIYHVQHHHKQIPENLTSENSNS